MADITEALGARCEPAPAIDSESERTKTPSLRSRPWVAPEVQSTTLDGETVVLHLSSGHYYTLNRVGTAIWDLCTGDNTLEDIHAALCARFEVPPQRAQDDLMNLVLLLDQKGLLLIERQS